ncbi:MAG: TolC family protein [Geminicoccaceae bacterium]
MQLLFQLPCFVAGQRMGRLIPMAACRLNSCAVWSLALASFFGLPTVPTVAQPAPTSELLPLSVADSVMLALRNNRNIESAYLDRIIQRFNLKVAEDTFVPDLIIDSTVDVDNVGVRGPNTTTNNILFAPTVLGLVPTGAFYTFSWINSSSRVVDALDVPDNYSTAFEFSVTQPLLRGAGIRVNRAPVTLARLDEEANQLQLRSTVIDTITSVVLAHRQVLLARGQEQIARQALQRGQQLLEVTNALVAAGRLAEIEIVQAESNLSLQELSLLAAENAADAARLNLLDQLDIDTRTQIETTDQVAAEEVAIDAAALLPIALANRPDYQQAQISIESANIAVLLAKNNRLWDLDLIGSVSVGSAEPAIADVIPGLQFTDPTWRIALNLIIPIGDLTREQGEIAANVLLGQVELATEDLHDSIDLAVRDGVRNVTSQWLQLEQAQRSRELEERKLAAELEKLNLGLSSNFQVVTFENDLANSQTNELNATINYLNALTQLDQTLGTTLETWQVGLTY